MGFLLLQPEEADNHLGYLASVAGVYPPDSHMLVYLPDGLVGLALSATGV